MFIGETDYLFHYTTIEKLALILKNKTIRLNSLVHMDDLQEGKAEDLSNLGRFFFVSCWTDDKTESIPMWKMYTHLESGVRIALPKNPFVRHGTRTSDIKGLYEGTADEEGRIDTFLDLAEMIRGGVFSVHAWSGEILTKVIYTDDMNLLEPKTVSINGNQLSLSIGNIGKYKNKYWEFQKEWRYIMNFVPFVYANIKFSHAAH